MELLIKLKNNKYHLILFLLLVLSCCFVGPRGNLYEWFVLLYEEGFEFALNNPKTNWYSNNNIFLNILLLSVAPIVLNFFSKKKSIIAIFCILIFNIWMISINCFCPHNDGYLIDGGDCMFFGKIGYGERVEASKINFTDDYLMSYENNPFFTGIVYENWPNGNKKRETQVYMGMPNGYLRMWNVDGQLIKEQYYYRYELAGPDREWYSNGQLKQESYYMFLGANKNSSLIGSTCWNMDGSKAICD